MFKLCLTLKLIQEIDWMKIWHIVRFCGWCGITINIFHLLNPHENPVYIVMLNWSQLHYTNELNCMTASTMFSHTYAVKIRFIFSRRSVVYFIKFVLKIYAYKTFNFCAIYISFCGKITKQTYSYVCVPAMNHSIFRS